MRNDIRYTPSDGFETFPFPEESALEDIAAELYETRASFMVETDQGLTKTYNALKDPANTDPPILHLRELHEQLDRAVLDAYGQSYIEVPPYCGADPHNSRTLRRRSPRLPLRPQRGAGEDGSQRGVSFVVAMPAMILQARAPAVVFCSGRNWIFCDG